MQYAIAMPALTETKKEYAARYYRRNRKRLRKGQKKYYQENRLRARERNEAWDRANPEKAKAIRQGINARYYQRNQASEISRCKNYRVENADKHRRAVKHWNETHPERVRAIKTRRRSREKRQLHPNLNCAVETALFLRAQEMTQKTGQLHHVDHIIPLEAGGWHHHFNLQILPATINLEKQADPFWEMKGFKSWRDVPCFLWPVKLVPAYEALFRV